MIEPPSKSSISPWTAQDFLLTGLFCLVKLGGSCGPNVLRRRTGSSLQGSPQLNLEWSIINIAFQIIYRSLWTWYPLQWWYCQITRGGFSGKSNFAFAGLGGNSQLQTNQEWTNLHNKQFVNQKTNKEPRDLICSQSPTTKQFIKLPKENKHLQNLWKPSRTNPNNSVVIPPTILCQPLGDSLQVALASRDVLQQDEQRTQRFATFWCSHSIFLVFGTWYPCDNTLHGHCSKGPFAGYPSDGRGKCTEVWLLNSLRR